MASLTKLSLFLTVVAAACTTSSPSQSEAPQIGKADGTSSDQADHDCQVVLRDVEFKPGSPYVSKDGYIVWQGNVDAAADPVQAGAEVAVLYSRYENQWYEVAGVKSTTDQTKPERFSFEMSYGITSGDEGGTNWQDMRIQVIPFLRFPSGSRLFDHNSADETDDNTNYVLTYGWGTGRQPFELTTDSTLCPQTLAGS